MPGWGATTPPTRAFARPSTAAVSWTTAPARRTRSWVSAGSPIGGAGQVTRSSTSSGPRAVPGRRPPGGRGQRPQRRRLVPRRARRLPTGPHLLPAGPWSPASRSATATVRLPPGTASATPTTPSASTGKRSPATSTPWTCTKARQPLLRRRRAGPPRRHARRRHGDRGRPRGLAVRSGHPGGARPSRRRSGPRQAPPPRRADREHLTATPTPPRPYRCQRRNRRPPPAYRGCLPRLSRPAA
jgi:hypothetical protein